MNSPVAGVAVLELHLPGDVALGVVEVAGPDAAVLIGEELAAHLVVVAVEVFAGYVAAVGGDRAVVGHDGIPVEAGEDAVACQADLLGLGQGDRADDQIGDDVVQHQGVRTDDGGFLDAQGVVAWGNWVTSKVASSKG